MVRDRYGRVKSRSCKDHDLATNQWVSFFASLLTPTASAATLDDSLTDESNTARTVRIYGTSTTNFNTTTPAGTKGAKLCLGDGGGSAVVPARTNVNLVNQLYEAFASTPAEGLGTIAIAATFVNSSGGTQTIREAGVKLSIASNAPVNHDFLMFHDATTATAVLNGESVTVTYTFTFP